MPSYPAKPYEVPHDDWFNNKQTNYESKPTTKETKKISTIHEFFYKQSDVKVGGSDNHIQTNLEKKSSTKIIISSLQNPDERLFSTVKEKYSYSKIPTKLKSINKRYCDGKAYDRNLSNKKFFNLKSYLLDLKSVFYKIIFRRKKKLN